MQCFREFRLLGRDLEWTEFLIWWLAREGWEKSSLDLRLKRSLVQRSSSNSPIIPSKLKMIQFIEEYSNSLKFEMDLIPISGSIMVLDVCYKNAFDLWLIQSLLHWIEIIEDRYYFPKAECAHMQNLDQSMHPEFINNKDFCWTDRSIQNLGLILWVARRLYCFNPS